MASLKSQTLQMQRPSLAMSSRRTLSTGASRVQNPSRRLHVAKASKGPEQPDKETLEAEIRLEAIERSRKRRKGEYDLPDDLKYSARAIAERESSSAAAEWEEGKLFPEGWEQMNVFEKGYNLYMGKRGVLFWANKAAYASVFLLIGGWIVFRFVGPALGLYKVAD